MPRVIITLDAAFGHYAIQALMPPLRCCLSPMAYARHDIDAFRHFRYALRPPSF